MCAQSLVATPMSSSPTSIFAPRGHHSSTNHWRILNDYASSNHNNSTSSPYRNAQTTQQGCESYVHKWLADTSQRDRRASAGRQQFGGGTMASAPVNQPRQADMLSSSSQHRQSSSRPAYERLNHSLSPDGGIRSASHTQIGNETEAFEDPQIVECLQIPPGVNRSRGSLTEFTARMACLFWFQEDAHSLLMVENCDSPSISPLPAEANPTVGYRKWVTTLLSTTQVSREVILLALLFIYRLKKITSNVKGKAGSEYRLLTVALMLGNKFLDDNTYTNKTWADVSGISVTEIHVMEVEFLSNMKYDLYTSAEDWDSWQLLLGKFAEYFERCLRAYNAIPTPMSMVASQLNAQTALTFTPPSEQLSPPHPAVQRIGATQRQLPSPLSLYNMATNLPQPPTRIGSDLRSTDLRAAGSRPASRKRSFDEPSFSLPNKQARTVASSQTGPSAATFLPFVPPQEASVSRLPPPAGPHAFTHTASPLNAPTYSAAVALNAQLTLPAPVAMPQDHLWQSMTNLPSNTPGTAGPSLPSLLTRPSRMLQSISHAERHDISPTNTTFVPLNNAHSPSNDLIYRNSPYRPVRQVNTLLAPPPSIATSNSPLQHMSQQATYYQPLSKGPIEPRQGMVPYLTPRPYQMAPMDPARQNPPADYRQYLGRR